MNFKKTNKKILKKPQYLGCIGNTPKKIKMGYKKYEELFDKIPSAVAIYETKDNGKTFIFKDFNKSGENIEKIKKEKLIGKNVVQVFPGIKKFGLINIFKRVWRTGKPEYFPISLYKDQRISGWRENYIYKLTTGEIMAIYEDSTKQKQIEEKIKLNEKKYKDLINDLPNGFVLINFKGDILIINKIMAKNLGAPQSKLIGKSLYSYLPKHKKILEQRFKKLKKNKKIEKFEDTIYLPSGKTRCFLSINEIIKNKKDSSDLIQIIWIDITDKKLEEEKLKEYKLLYETSSDAFMILEPPSWKFTSGNPSILKMFNVRSEKKFKTIGPWDVSPKYQPDGELSSIKAKKMIKKAMEKGNNFFEWTHKKINGENFPATVLLTKFKYKNKNILQATVRDITKEKESEKLKNEFISIASHQLRTPLSGIKWFSELLMDEKTGKLNETQKDFIRKIYEENKNLILLTKDLLDVSNIETGLETDSKKEKFAVKKIINEILKDLDFLIKQKEIKIILSKNLTNKIILFDDKEKIKQILHNLINNSVKYSKQKGKIEIKYKKINKNKINFSIKDHGVGIPENEQKKIFQKFFRAKNISTKSSGTGLGLYITKALIESSKGKIWFKSKENNGSTFYLTLPLKNK